MSLRNEAIPDLVESTEVERFSPARVRLSSKDKGRQDILLTEFVYQTGAVPSCPRPAVPDHSILLMESGMLVGEYTYNHAPWQPLRLRQGDLAIGQAYQNCYDWRGYAQVGEDAEVVALVVHVSPKLLARVAANEVGVDGDQIELIHRINIRDSCLTQYLTGIKTEIQLNGLYGQAYLEATSLGLAVHLLRNYCSVHYRLPETKGRLPAHRLRRVLDYVDSHLHREISIDTLARLVYLSPYYFIKLFKETTGETPHQFILHKRIERAKHLLRNTGKPISQIAIDVGYGYPCNFSSAFKQSTGVTPASYRKGLRLVAPDPERLQS